MRSPTHEPIVMMRPPSVMCFSDACVATWSARTAWGSPAGIVQQESEHDLSFELTDPEAYRHDFVFEMFEIYSVFIFRRKSPEYLHR
jgi:hypothetical protein